MADSDEADAMKVAAVADDTSAAAVTRKHKKKAKKKRKKNKKRTEDDMNNETMTTMEKINGSSTMINPNAKRQKLSRDKNDETKTNHVVEAAEAKKEVDATVTTAGSVPPVSKRKRKKKKKKDRRIKNPNTIVVSPKEEETSSSTTPNQVKKQDDEESEIIATFPFPTDPDDHCESPLQAYCHIQPFLLHLFEESRNIRNGNHNSKGKKVDCRDLRIYDPYYCNGAVIDNLTMLGFPNVYNKKEDCYKTWESSSSSSSYPEFDLILTNPPYSGDHIEKLIQHITSPRMGNRAWLLLLPDWVHKKDYFINRTKQKHIQPFYLVPKKRYVYLPPKNYRTAKKSDVHKKSSPFNSMWYVWGGTTEQTNRLIQHYYDNRNCLYPSIVNRNKTGSGSEQETATTTISTNQMPLSEACDLARSKSALRDLRRKFKKK